MMINPQYRRKSLSIASAVLATVIVGCQTQTSSPSPQTPPPTSTPAPLSSTPTTNASQPTGETLAPAVISAIEQTPVWVKQLNATAEVAAAIGTPMQFGETIRTEGDALAQVDLENGLAFRVGGDAVLTLQPDNQLKLDQGDMIVWVEPGKQVPTEVLTPVGIAGLRGTTLFISVPKQADGEIEIFAWEGTVSLRLPNQPDEIVLKGGEQLLLRRGDTRIDNLRRRVRRLNRREIRLRRRQSLLLSGFQSPLPTQSKIDQMVESLQEGP